MTRWRNSEGRVVPGRRRSGALARRSQGTVLSSHVRWSRERVARTASPGADWQPREVAEHLEGWPRVPEGEGDRFDGYGVLGMPFGTGDVLAFRRYPASSLGTAYTSVWHRDVAGRWTFFSDVDARKSCARYARPSLAEAVTTDIRIVWTGARSLTLLAPGVGLEWSVALGTTPMSWLLNRVAHRGGARSERALDAIGMAARLMGAGALRLHGRTPTGHRFRFMPSRLWTVSESRAYLEGRSLGDAVRSRAAVRLGEFRVPRRGLFAFASASFEAPDAELAWAFGDLPDPRASDLVKGGRAV